MTSTRSSKPTVVPADSSITRTKPAPADAVKARRASVKAKSNTRKPHTLWLDDEISSALAWICKNKGDWEMNKSASVDHLSKNVINGRHSPQAVYIKLRNMHAEFNKCFEFVQYDDQDEPVRKVLSKSAEKVKFFKECRAAFGLPAYVNGTFVQKLDGNAHSSYPKEKASPIVAETLEQDPSNNSSPTEPKRAHSESLPGVSLSPATKARRIVKAICAHSETLADVSQRLTSPSKGARSRGIVADDNRSPSSALDEHTPTPGKIKDEDGSAPVSGSPNYIQASKGERTDEQRLKIQELRLSIQATKVTMRRSELRFERLQEKHQYRQARRGLRLKKHTEELDQLMADD